MTFPEQIENFRVETFTFRDATSRAESIPDLTGVKITACHHSAIEFEIANPEKTFYENLYAFQFGACASKNVLVWADSLEDGLEEAAQYLRERGWVGLFTDPDYEDVKRDFEKDVGRPATEDDEEAIYDLATTDLTYTESGYIASYEWWVQDASEEQIAVCTQIRDLLNAEED